jgi:hypothetical protein
MNKGANDEKINGDAHGGGTAHRVRSNGFV